MTGRNDLDIAAILAMPDAEAQDGILPTDAFDPWECLFPSILGDYASESDRYMLIAMRAVRDRATLAAIERHGFIVEFMLYVLAGHGLLDYGTSPRGAWIDGSITADEWSRLIAKYERYYVAVWGEPVDEGVTE